MAKPCSRSLCLVPTAVLLAACASLGTLPEDVEFDGPDGKEVFEIEADARGFEVNDPNDNEIADFRYVEGQGLRIEDGGNTKLGYARPDGKDLVIVDPNGRELYRLVVKPNGDAELRAPAGVLYGLEKRSDGYKVVDGNGAAVGRVKCDEDISIRDNDGRKLLECKARMSRLAGACMAFASVPTELRLGLLTGVVAYRIGE